MYGCFYDYQSVIGKAIQNGTPFEPCSDAISREAVISIIEESQEDDADEWMGYPWKVTPNLLMDEMRKLPPVTPKQEPCEDCISRADAEALFRNARGELHKSAIRNEQNGHPIKDLPTRDLMLLNAEQMIHLLPPVTPQEPSNDMVSRGVFEQVMWERDVAIEQLKELGYGFGEKPRTGHWIPIEYPTGVEAFGVKEMSAQELQCSECGKTVDISDGDFKYCPYCKTKMVEPQESERV